MKIVEKTRKIAAHELEVSDEDLDYAGGTFSVKGAPDRAKTVPGLAWSAGGDSVAHPAEARNPVTF